MLRRGARKSSETEYAKASSSLLSASNWAVCSRTRCSNSALRPRSCSSVERTGFIGDCLVEGSPLTRTLRPGFYSRGRASSSINVVRLRKFEERRPPSLPALVPLGVLQRELRGDNTFSSVYCAGLAADWDGVETPARDGTVARQARGCYTSPHNDYLATACCRHWGRRPNWLRTRLSHCLGSHVRAGPACGLAFDRNRARPPCAPRRSDGIG